MAGGGGGDGPVSSVMTFLDVSRWKHRRIGLPLLLLLLLFWFYTFGTPSLRLSTPATLQAPAAEPVPVQEPLTEWNLSYLAPLKLSPTFKYARRSIKIEHYDGERLDMTVVRETLFPSSQKLKKKRLDHVRLEDRPPLILSIPNSPKVDTSIVSFGIATSNDRLPTALEQLSHWLSDSGCPLHVIAPPEPETLPEIQASFARHAINLTVHESKQTFPIAYFSVLKVLYDTRLPHTKWLVLIDDDTFVPSLPSLVKHLETNYDASKEVMVAAATEDMHQINIWGLIPYGGGGIFLSVPLAEHLVRPKIWDVCVTGMGHDQGDGILSDCLFTYTSTRPTFSHVLNQMDFRENAIGMFESGRPMLTIHHWKSWFEVDMPRAALVSKASGDEGILQRWMFPDSNLVINNGYTITSYPNGVESVDFEAVEKTWEGEAERFIHHVGPLRAKMNETDKLSFELQMAEEVENVGIRQVYVKEAKKKHDQNEVLELLWQY